MAFRQIGSGGPVHHLLYDAVLTWLFVGEIPKGIGKLGKLTRLDLSDNQLAGQHFFVSIQAQPRQINRGVRCLCF